MCMKCVHLKMLIKRVQRHVRMYARMHALPRYVLMRKCMQPVKKTYTWEGFAASRRIKRPRIDPCRHHLQVGCVPMAGERKFRGLGLSRFVHVEEKRTRRCFFVFLLSMINLANYALAIWTQQELCEHEEIVLHDVNCVLFTKAKAFSIFCE